MVKYLVQATSGVKLNPQTKKLLNRRRNTHKVSVKRLNKDIFIRIFFEV